MSAPGFLGGPVPIGGKGGTDREAWFAAHSPLDPAEVRRLTREGLRSDQIAARFGVPLVHVAETAFAHGLTLIAAPQCDREVGRPHRPPVVNREAALHRRWGE